MRRVLSVIHGVVFGGPSNINMRVAPLLAKNGFEINVVLPDEPGDALGRLRQAGVAVISIPLHRMRATLHPAIQFAFITRFWPEVNALRRIIRNRDIDIVQLNGLVNSHAAIAAKLERRRIVWQIVDTRPPMILRQLIMPLVTRVSDVIMSTGRAVAATHPGALDFGNRLITFFPPVDFTLFRPSPELRLKARVELGLPADAMVIGTVGNVNPMKGHLTFLRAAAALRRAYPDARFVILGTQYEHFQGYVNRVWQEAHALGLQRDRDLIIREPESRVSELVHALDIFWMTSEPRSEGIPTVIGEAMGLELPVVSTDVGSVAEAVHDGVNGYVVPPLDAEAVARATERILGTPGAARELGQKGRTFAKAHYGIERCAERHLAAYRMALGIRTAS